MADVTMRVKVDGSQANAEIDKIDANLGDAAKTAGSIGSRLARGVAGLARGAAGAVGGAMGGALAGGGAAALLGDPFQSKTIAMAQAALNRQYTLKTPGLFGAGAEVSATGEQILGMTDPATLAKFKGAVSAQDQVQAIAAQAAAAGHELTDSDISGLFDLFSGISSKQMAERQRVANALDSKMAKLTLNASEAISNLAGTDPDIRAAGQEGAGQ